MGDLGSNPLTVGMIVRERYKILAVVGRGGLGTVYQVSDILYGWQNIYALKELADQSPGARKQFELESQWLQSLDHNHIPKVREHFEWSQRIYLVMDFVDGENLEQKLSRLGGRPLPEQQVLNWIMPICDALQYLHTRIPPILHRDVKPANIIVTPSGHPVLVDLGIAKEHLPGAGQTATFVRKAGTEGYAPPEQYTAAGQTGPWSDVYGLGATLYQLLTGGVPPTAVERVALDARLLHPRDINPMISGRTDAAICRALSIRPVERYQSVAEFARELSGAMSFPPLPPVSRSAASAVSSNSPLPSSQPSRHDGASVPPLPPPASASPQGAVSPAAMMLPPSAPPVGAAAGDQRSRPGSDAPRGATTGRMSAVTTADTYSSSTSIRTSGKTAAAVAVKGDKRGRGGIVILIAGIVVLAIVAVVAMNVLRLASPPDRSSAEATIGGYFAALSQQDYALAWQYDEASRNSLTSQSEFEASLKADDVNWGRVLTATIGHVEEDNSGRTVAQVSVTRAHNPSTVLVYSVSVSQYGGDTWLITSIATS